MNQRICFEIGVDGAGAVSVGVTTGGHVDDSGDPGAAPTSAPGPAGAAACAACGSSRGRAVSFWSSGSAATELTSITAWRSCLTELPEGFGRRRLLFTGRRQVVPR
jgi:hypothetical protein